MFVVLRTVEPAKGFFNRISQKRSLARSEVQAHPTQRGLPFFILEALDGRNGIDWNAVAEKSGRYASRIIAPRCLTLPDCGKLKRFVPLSMNSLLIFNTALDIIKKANLNPEDICITLTDRNGVHASRVCSLLPFASLVRVVTLNPERYADACANALDEYGASIIIRCAYEQISKPDIVICCDGGICSPMKKAAVFTSKRRTGGCLLFSGGGLVLTDEHLDIIPSGIDPIDFAGALTELCGSPEYKASVFSEIEINCSYCGGGTPEKCLACYCSGGAPPPY